jgi:two-component system nitrogen regulation response regulator NtrX
MRSYIEKNIQDHSQISRCLVVEDDASQLDLIRRQLSRLEPGIQIDLAGDYEEGLKSLKTNRYDFVLCDVMLPNNQSGVDLWRKVSRAGNFTPFVMTSGLRKEEFSEKFRFGEQAPEFLSKPFKLMDLQTKVDSVLMDIAIDPIELNFK